MVNALTDDKIALLAEMVREKYGLDFAPDRWRDLRTAVMNFHEENNRFCSCGECLDYILSPQACCVDLEQFINRLTIGETYFFRDPRALDVLEMDILRKQSGRGSGVGGAMRIWSMACATGEEPYTMAMICRRSNVRSEIYGTDIDSRALAKAREGHYRKWSFRSESMAFRDIYFKQSGPNDYTIEKSIRDMVKLSRFNLIGDEVPASFMLMDLVLCRNVLMYFSESGVKRVLDKIWTSLTPGGVLLVTPSESSLVTNYRRFEPVNFGSVMLFRKNEEYSPPSNGFETYFTGVSDPGFCVPDFLQQQAAEEVGEVVFEGYEPLSPAKGPDLFVHEDSGNYEVPEPAAAPEINAGQCSGKDFLTLAGQLRIDGDPAGAMNLLKKSLETELSRACRSEIYYAMAEIKADAGLLDEASACCGRSIDLDRIAPKAHFLLGQIKMLQGCPEGAISELRNAVFLDSGFVMAHVMLGNIYTEQNDFSVASRHFRIAMQELQTVDGTEIVPHSDGTTAAVLMDMIRIVQQNLA